MAVTLPPDQRDALYSQVLADLNLFGDLEVAVSAGKEEDAYRLGRRLVDALRLVLDGGSVFQKQTLEPTTITLSESELRGIMLRLRERALDLFDSRLPDHQES